MTIRWTHNFLSFFLQGSSYTDYGKWTKNSKEILWRTYGNTGLDIFFRNIYFFTAVEEMRLSRAAGGRPEREITSSWTAVFDVIKVPNLLLQYTKFSHRRNCWQNYLFWRMIHMYEPAQTKIPPCIDTVYINAAKQNSFTN